MKTKILAEFQICISVPLMNLPDESTEGALLRKVFTNILNYWDIHFCENLF